jgi:hypothetical protein
MPSFATLGDSLEIQDLKHTFDFESTEGLDLAKFGAHTITGLLKLYIRELPDPLLTYDRYIPLFYNLTRWQHHVAR